MKVLDLQCAQGHAFEGWFGSEADFVSQCERALVQCPLCGDAAVHKMLSAPRLNLSTSRQDNRGAEVAVSESAPTAGSVNSSINSSVPPSATSPVTTAALADPAITAAWLELARRIVASTQDVGESFAEEARRMHYGESEERAIRGKTTLDEARALVEEGIDILPMVLPQSLKKTLQ